MVSYPPGMFCALAMVTVSSNSAAIMGHLRRRCSIVLSPLPYLAVYMTHCQAVVSHPCLSRRRRRPSMGASRRHLPVVLLSSVFVPVRPLLLHAPASVLHDNQQPRSYLHRV